MTDEKTFEIVVDGKPIRAREGQSVAEALVEGGITTFRFTRNGAPRGPFCNMGACYECRMVIDGRANTRACMTPAAPGRRVQTQDDARLEVPDDRR